MFDGYESEKKYEDNNKFSEHCKEFYKNISSSLRGSAFGCFIGLVPHIGAAVSSNLSYAIEKKMGTISHQRRYKNISSSRNSQQQYWTC